MKSATHRMRIPFSVEVPDAGYPKPVTNKAKRLARKRFMKHKQVPNGWHITARSMPSVEANPIATDKVKSDFRALDIVAYEKYSVGFEKLSLRKQKKVIHVYVDRLHNG